MRIWKESALVCLRIVMWHSSTDSEENLGHGTP
jgi:hypothetical protein